MFKNGREEPRNNNNSKSELLEPWRNKQKFPRSSPSQGTIFLLVREKYRSFVDYKSEKKLNLASVNYSRHPMFILRRKQYSIMNQRMLLHFLISYSNSVLYNYGVYEVWSDVCSRGKQREGLFCHVSAQAISW